MNSPPKLKRKKKVKVCPNPLFVQWLTDWRDAAAEKGIKTQYAYGKALVALKKYPLPFESGKAAKILDNFGDKICGMLDKKLEEHYAKQAESPPAVVDIDNDDSDEIVDIQSSSAAEYTNILQDKAVNEGTRKKKSSPRSATKREYIPLHRSGPYSLILTLYRNHTRPGSKGYMHKTELQDAAQPLCDKAMKIPDPGSHYTAWSSMSTLINKGYVYKEGSPARYIITESGCDLAHKIEAVDIQQPTTVSPSVPGRLPSTAQQPATDHLPRIPPLDNTTAVDHEDHISILASRSICRSVLNVPNYCYVDDQGREVTLKDEAAVTVNDDGVGFLIKCSETSLQSSSLRYSIDRERTAVHGLCYAFLHNDDASEVCPASKSSLSVNEELDRVAEISKKASLSHSESGSSYAPSSYPSSFRTHQSSFRVDSDGATNKEHRSEKTSSDHIMPAPVFTLRPGQFDVILCVDNCETTGIGGREGKGRKHVLLKELQKNGVNLDVRKLQVGDFLWVAREKGSAVPGMLQMPQRREAVLDYVVERKRMDDLCSSIQDGRFKEQKFRLKQCGLGHPIYLVEDFGSTDHMSIPAATLLQSAVNTQVIDGFFVKNTHDSKESAAYLTIMTRYLNSLYSGKTIKAYQREDLDNISHLTDMNSHQQHCLTFREFNESSVKNKETTVTETFAKHLLQFNGMTAEKALALTQLYQTPSDLMRAYESCSLPSDQEKMLAKIKYGHSQRNMGPALSKLVYQLYCSSNALT
ncbi:crossover junction endonuclease MUS81-like [Lytechinus pictus]|uniref:crossover junction endonuclease MUS81-like n=1 Tax=Lytechinus pictus TaxID=7653 RepID=UPI0030BA1962